MRPLRAGDYIHKWYEGHPHTYGWLLVCDLIGNEIHVMYPYDIGPALYLTTEKTRFDIGLPSFGGVVCIGH